jgi:hypothetical protein
MKKQAQTNAILSALAVVAMLFCAPHLTTTAAPIAAIDTRIDHTTYGWALENAKKNPDGTVTITIMEVPGFQTKTYTTAISLADAAHMNSVTGVTRADALANEGSNAAGMPPGNQGVLAKDSFVEIQFNAASQCVDMEVIEFSAVTYMDSASYGGELTAKGGGAGNMVSTGWVLGKDKSKNTVTIGDGNHLTNVFEETYTLAKDCRIYLVDNPTTDGKIKPGGGFGLKYSVPGSWGRVKEGTFDDIKVCDRKDGEIYYVPERWTAVSVFDSNYKISWKDGKAKVKELYLFNNPLRMSKTDMHTPDGVQYDGTSWYPAKSKLEEKTSFSYAGSVEPIEFLKNRLYDVGDSYTEIYMFVGDDGTLTLLDQGNRCAAYQYWLNIAKEGYDPRAVRNILLTHGHGDHYQALYENARMIMRAGGKVACWINPYSQGAAIEDSSYKVGATLADAPVLSVTDGRIEWDKWMNFMGPGISVYAWRSLGHTNDTASFVFKVTATKDDAYFKKGDVVSFVYYGGFGSQPNLSAGALRLAIMGSLQYEQSVIAPWAKAQSDYVYALPQHSNHYSILEIYKAGKIAKIPFMQGLTEGVESVANICEKRVSVQLYEWAEQAYRSKTDAMGNMLEKAAGFRCDSSARDSYDTVEAHGPYKRPDGEYTLKVQGVSVIHGFDAFINKNEKFAGQKNIYGFDLSKGFVTDKDSYTHDPDGWYVQVICNVLDNYDGGVNYDTNWYKGKYVAGANDIPIARPWSSGPVEISISPHGWTEILRTERFDTRAKAEAYAKALTGNAYASPYAVYSVNGKMYSYADKGNHAITDHDGKGAALSAASYKVNLNKASEILLSDSFEKTFRKVD